VYVTFDAPAGAAACAAGLRGRKFEGRIVATRFVSDDDAIFHAPRKVTQIQERVLDAPQIQLTGLVARGRQCLGERGQRGLQALPLLCGRFGAHLQQHRCVHSSPSRHDGGSGG
jgi:hypothetical protein